MDLNPVKVLGEVCEPSSARLRHGGSRPPEPPTRRRLRPAVAQAGRDAPRGALPGPSGVPRITSA